MLQCDWIRYTKPFLAMRNRELERPLSLLMVNANNIENLIECSIWVRRIAVFTDNHKVYYHLVAIATGMDFYTKFNFKLIPSIWGDIPSNLQLTWPFDVINISLDQDCISKGMLSIQSWKDFFSTQLFFAEQFLLIVHGEMIAVNQVDQILHNLQDGYNTKMILKQLSFKTFSVEGITHGIRIWSICNKPLCVRERECEYSVEDLTEIMLWGEDDQ